MYGADDRREAFESNPGERALLERSLVALVPKQRLATSEGRVRVMGASLGQAVGLCPGEAFAGQPDAAFCSGVLVDWDLVLTAGHCAHAIAVDDLAVVFGYFYPEPGRLALTADDVYQVSVVAGEAETPSKQRPDLDHAWLRLGRSVRPPRAPVAIRTDLSKVHAGDRITFVGTGGGVPLKVDTGGVIADAGEPWRDRFLASTDTSAGASGGGAFDADLVLTGLLEGGGLDYVPTADGCKTAHHPDPGVPPEERFPYAEVAVEELCAGDPTATTLCRSGCGDPCVALPPDDAGGCTIARRPRSGAPLLLLLWAALLGRMGLGLVRAPAGRRAGATRPGALRRKRPVLTARPAVDSDGGL